MRKLILALLGASAVFAQSDFTIVQTGDMHSGSFGTGYWQSVASWIVAQKATWSIEAYVGVGDWNNTPTNSHTIWNSGGNGLKAIKDAGIAWISPPGNHDHNPDNGVISTRDTHFYYGELGYGRASTTDNPNFFSSWAGEVGDVPSFSHPNYCIRFTAGGSLPVLLCSLEFWPRKAGVTDIHTTIAAQTSDYAMVVSHGFLNHNGTITSATDNYGLNAYSLDPTLNHSGTSLWTALSDLPTLKMILSGHQTSATVTTRHAHSTATATDGHSVFMGMSNWQDSYLSTSTTTTITPGSRTVTPASMGDIEVGITLTVGGEVVKVTAVTSTTFTATFASSHSGTSAITGSETAVVTLYTVRPSSGVVEVRQWDTITDTEFTPTAAMYTFPYVAPAAPPPAAARRQAQSSGVRCSGCGR